MGWHGTHAPTMQPNILSAAWFSMSRTTTCSILFCFGTGGSASVASRKRSIRALGGVNVVVNQTKTRWCVHELLIIASGWCDAALIQLTGDRDRHTSTFGCHKIEHPFGVTHLHVYSEQMSACMKQHMRPLLIGRGFNLMQARRGSSSSALPQLYPSRTPTLSTRMQRKS